jgi:hypothetical protein
MSGDQKPEPIHFPDCYLEKAGQSDGYQNVFTDTGSPIFSVPEGEYPEGTHFDVTITYVVKPPRVKGPRLVKAENPKENEQ